MTTTALEEVTIELTGTELPVHIVCMVCYPELIPFGTYGMCGALLAGIDMTWSDVPNCVVCRDMRFEPCPKCGI